MDYRAGQTRQLSLAAGWTVEQGRPVSRPWPRDGPWSRADPSVVPGHGMDRGAVQTMEGAWNRSKSVLYTEYELAQPGQHLFILPVVSFGKLPNCGDLGFDVPHLPSVGALLHCFCLGGVVTFCLAFYRLSRESLACAS